MAITTVTVAMPSDMLDWFQSAANEMGLTLDAFMRIAGGRLAFTEGHYPTPDPEKLTARDDLDAIASAPGGLAPLQDTVELPARVFISPGTQVLNRHIPYDRIRSTDHVWFNGVA